MSLKNAIDIYWKSLIVVAFVPLAGCVDYFTVDREPGRPLWTGTTTEAAQLADADCRPFRLEFTLEDPLSLKQARIEGRGFPVGAPEPTLYRDLRESWWVTGEAFENGTVLFTLRRQSPTVDGPRWSSQWRGTLEGDQIIAEEEPVSCRRTVVAQRQP
jgi:hypothetical protein